MFPLNSLRAAVFSVGLLTAVFLANFIAFAWTEPGSPPPSGNVSAPVNVGATAQTKSGALTVTTLTASNGFIYLNDSGEEGDIQRVNAIVGHNDLFLKGNLAENAAVHIAGSQLSFWSGGAEKWKIDSSGNLTMGSVPWARLSGVPADLADGDNDTRCDVSGTCSQVCIGANCRTSWPTGVTDHGGLTGLGDDDHPQYVLDAGDTMTGLLTVSVATDEKLRLRDDATRYYSFNVGDDGALAIKDEGGNVRFKIDDSGNIIISLANCNLDTDANGRLTCGSDAVDDSVSGSELDGVFSTNGILRRTGAGTYSTVSDYSDYWVDSVGTNGQVWKSDGSGRGVWGTDNDTWQQNLQNQPGYVTAGGTNYNKVWKTDGVGNPSWRDDLIDDSVSSAELDGICATNDKILKRISGTWQCADPAAGGSGDITGVIAGTGLSGGGTSGDVTLSATLGTSISSAEIDDGTIIYSDTDVNSVQRRISGYCDAGNSIRSINSDGTVACEDDTDTNANTICSGTNVYLDGDGNCDTLTVPDTSTFVQKAGDAMSGNLRMGERFNPKKILIGDLERVYVGERNDNDSDALQLYGYNGIYANSLQVSGNLGVGGNLDVTGSLNVGVNPCQTIPTDPTEIPDDEVVYKYCPSGTYVTGCGYYIISSPFDVYVQRIVMSAAVNGCEGRFRHPGGGDGTIKLYANCCF